MPDAPVSGCRSKMPKVALLMTRPQEGSLRFVAQLPAEILAQLEVIHAPLMQVTPLATAVDLTGYQGVIFTSANGVAAAVAHPPRCPPFALGSARPKPLNRQGGRRGAVVPPQQS